ncbi:hypothetical protein [Nannocystis sp. SCPEA4]|uniref:hypothetical protein n=1 Tax=Nannocystis sp. SCPEA4 TaxID=2996787 RepID=UPI0022715F80|nr:hypothetical protein [Nannocystis sp. SCPEA4]MCY1061222.1 hypothetical protein [Nannocystis sp. SCPEA4]
MLRYDLISWWATDALFADGFDASSLRGWLVTPGQETAGDARMLGVLPAGDVGVVASIRCDVAGGPSSCVIDRGFEPRPLSDEERAMQRAIETARADKFFVRAQSSYNTIALRAADHGVDAGWIVYIVASTTDPDVIPVGRHFRFDVSKNGSRVLRRRASHRSVMEFRRSEAGLKVAGIAATSVFDVLPSEFQLYVSSLWRMPLTMVGCKGSIWSIDGLKATQLESVAAKLRCFDPWNEK